MWLRLEHLFDRVMIVTSTADLRTHALRVAAAVAPEAMSGAAAAAAVADFAVVEKAAATARMFLALRVARTDAWSGQGHASAADWLAAQTGISVREAHRQLGTARKADRLPKTKDAMRRGDLSPEQADAVTDAASVDPGAEDDLLAAAANDTHKALRDKAAKAKAAATDDAARRRRIHERRSLRRGTDAEGAFWARLYGPGDAAAGFEELLRPFEELIFRHHRANGIRSTHENRSFDAFFALLAFLDAAKRGGASPSSAEPSVHPPDHAPPPTASPAPSPSGGAPETTSERQPERAPAPPPPAGPPDPDPDHRATTWRPPWNPEQTVGLPNRLPGGNNVKVIVLVDHAALLRGRTTAGETCEITGVGPISVETARAILRDDPFLAVVVRRGRDVVNVAHHGRGLNAHQRTAIEAGGLRCTNVACNRTIAIEIDHRTPWAADPITALANQDPLCPGCHRQKTHHGWCLEPGAGPRRFLPPDRPNPSHEAHVPDPPGVPDGRCAEPPTGAALLKLERPLTKPEADRVEARLRASLAARGAPVRPNGRSTPSERAQEAWC